MQKTYLPFSFFLKIREIFRQHFMVMMLIQRFIKRAETVT